MGILQQSGAALGSWYAGPGTALSSAQSSLEWGALATGLDVGANIAAGIEGAQAMAYRAKLAREGAGATRLAGQAAESAVKADTTRTVAAQRAAQAASGVDVDSKSAEAVRDATAQVGALDAAMIHYNAAREAYGLDASAAMYKRAGRSALVKGAVGAGLSFLGGARSLGDKWDAYRRSGAYNG